MNRSFYSNSATIYFETRSIFLNNGDIVFSVLSTTGHAAIVIETCYQHPTIGDCKANTIMVVAGTYKAYGTAAFVVEVSYGQSERSHNLRSISMRRSMT